MAMKSDGLASGGDLFPLLHHLGEEGIFVASCHITGSISQLQCSALSLDSSMLLFLVAAPKANTLTSK